VLYKVTPQLTPVEAKKPASDPAAEGTAVKTKEARKRRKSAVYDAEGNEVLITMMCLKCKAMKPLTMFGLRKMADGAIRNQPWCRTCRSGATPPKKKNQEVEAVVEAEPVLQAATAGEAAPAASAEPERKEPLSVIEQLLAGPVPM
jgi:hypothetical protein